MAVCDQLVKLYKTKLCAYHFSDRGCAKGRRCNFSHDEKEVRQPELVTKPSTRRMLPQAQEVAHQGPTASIARHQGQVATCEDFAARYEQALRQAQGVAHQGPAASSARHQGQVATCEVPAARYKQALIVAMQQGFFRHSPEEATDPRRRPALRPSQNVHHASATFASSDSYKHECAAMSDQGMMQGMQPVMAQTQPGPCCMVPVGVVYSVQPLERPSFGVHTTPDWSGPLGQSRSADSPQVTGQAATQKDNSGACDRDKPKVVQFITEAQAQATLLMLTTDGAGSQLPYHELVMRLEEASEWQRFALAQALGRVVPDAYQD